MAICFHVLNRNVSRYKKFTSLSENWPVIPMVIVSMTRTMLMDACFVLCLLEDPSVLLNLRVVSHEQITLWVFPVLKSE